MLSRGALANCENSMDLQRQQLLPSTCKYDGLAVAVAAYLVHVDVERARGQLSQWHLAEA